MFMVGPNVTLVNSLLLMPVNTEMSVKFRAKILVVTAGCKKKPVDTTRCKTGALPMHTMK